MKLGCFFCIMARISFCQRTFPVSGVRFNILKCTFRIPHIMNKILVSIKLFQFSSLSERKLNQMALEKLINRMRIQTRQRYWKTCPVVSYRILLIQRYSPLLKQNLGPFKILDYEDSCPLWLDLYFFTFWFMTNNMPSP